MAECFLLCVGVGGHFYSVDWKCTEGEESLARVREMAQVSKAHEKGGEEKK